MATAEFSKFAGILGLVPTKIPIMIDITVVIETVQYELNTYYVPGIFVSDLCTFTHLVLMTTIGILISSLL